MMKNSPSYDSAAIELGKKILAQFDKREDRGIMTSWMSHHVAELITRSENEKGTSAQSEIQRECVETILKLWAHRNSLPNGSRPFERVEKAAQALARIAPDTHENFYFRTHLSDHRSNKNDIANAGFWLDFAETFDRDARELIRICLGKSLAASVVDIRDWLNASDGLEDELAIDIQVVKGLVENCSDQELEEVANTDACKRTKATEQLDKIIEKLSSLRAAAVLQINS